jgi:lysophospholipase L1-like esterase
MIECSRIGDSIRLKKARMNSANKHTGETKPKRPWYKTLLFLLLAGLLVFAAIEAGFRVKGILTAGRVGDPSAIDPCKDLVFYFLGDSFTYGLFVDPDQSFPARFTDRVNQVLASEKVRAVNLGLPGTNTSEGIEILERFLEREDAPPADFAVIMYGENNAWNLHHASFWDWGDKYKQGNYVEYLTSKLRLSKAFKIVTEDRAGNLNTYREKSRRDYRDVRDEKGEELFFPSLSDPLLAEWIERDLGRMVELLVAKNVRPILLAYPYGDPEHLPRLMQQAATRAGIPFLDAARNFGSFENEGLLAKDGAHLNAKGNDAFAQRTLERFFSLFSVEQLQSVLNEKRESGSCS